MADDVECRDVECGGVGARLVVPAYFGPDERGVWSQLFQAGSRAGYVVINSADGPGSCPVPGLAEIVAAARQVGQHVVGYVWTDYGRRPSGSVLADIERYADWYDVNSIFLDGIQAEAEHATGYRRYIEAIRARGGLAVLNPGVVPDPIYFQMGDAVVTYEGCASDYRNGCPWPPHMRDVPSRQVIHLVYAAAAEDVDVVLRLASERGAQRVYVTDGVPPNPWSGLPSYWAAVLTALAEGGSRWVREGQK